MSCLCSQYNYGIYLNLLLINFVSELGNIMIHVAIFGDIYRYYDILNRINFDFHAQIYHNPSNATNTHTLTLLLFY